MEILTHWAILALDIAAAITAAAHALLTKRDPRAAWGWIAVCLMFPLAGPVAYVLFGVNRVQARGLKLRRRSPFALHECRGQHSGQPSQPIPEEFVRQARIAYKVSGRELLGGNCVDILHNGEEAYPAMLSAIEQARQTVCLATYLFESNETGRSFVNALARAQDRGVDVRVVIDGVGELTTAFPPIGWLLSASKIPFARFLPPRLLPPSLYINLRMHHKILVVDGKVAFTGGMNIGDHHLAAREDLPRRATDVHFRFQGPIVGQIAEVFHWDWGFALGKECAAPEVIAKPCGPIICRAMADGPTGELDKLPMILMVAIAAARERVWIMTPYFLPPPELASVMVTAAMRGVDVCVVLPQRSDSRFLDYAMRSRLRFFIERGIRFYRQPPPFAHSKLLLVDRHYSLVGSANLDPRSLLLNFELVVEIYDADVTSRLETHFLQVCERSAQVSVEECVSRTLPQKLRDATCWLFSPYL